MLLNELMATVAPELVTLHPADLCEAAEGDDRKQITDLLHSLMTGADGSGLADLARRRERVGRLLEAIGELDRSPGSDYALGQLQLIDRFLDQTRTRALGIRAQQQREASLQTVRERVYELVHEKPRRPREIASELEVDASQVSRALRELRASGMVEQSETTPNDGTNDGRAHVYTARTGRVARAAQQPAALTAQASSALG
jgi:DNA-binding MarR family transcriptional regulator